MELFTDVVFLARFQFAFVVVVHFLFVPVTIGTGLIMAIMQTKAHRSGSKQDSAAARFWMKIFTISFAVGVATGITMEFSFGTNWAAYSRFVGDIFGAPLAAEALSAFFLESVFLGVLLFGRNKVNPTLYTVSAWLVFFGSCLSALWILIANSWMQTPAGYELAVTDAGTKAVIVNFFDAAINYSTVPRYFHTIVAAILMGSFVAIAVGGWHMLKGNESFGKKTLGIGSVICVIALVLMVPAAHQQAVEVSEQQQAKFAAMEGQWEAGASDMAIVGWVDEANKQTYAIDVPIPGMTSWLASGNFDEVYPGLNDYEADLLPPVNLTFQSYHVMVICFGLMGLCWILAMIAWRSKKQPPKWLLRLLTISPLFPVFAIQSGWFVTEFGRQPWIVYGELLTADANSLAVSAGDLLFTIAVFIVLYIFLLVVYLRFILRAVKEGPKVDDDNVFDFFSEKKESAIEGAARSDGYQAAAQQDTSETTEGKEV